MAMECFRVCIRLGSAGFLLFYRSGSGTTGLQPEDAGMKKLDLAAILLITLFVLNRLFGTAFRQLAIQSGVDFQWTNDQIDQMVWLIRVVPLVAIHIGFAIWLHRLAIADQYKHPNRWRVFGLCFGLVAGVVYLTMGIIQKLPDNGRVNQAVAQR
jgi:hypothetical protein